MDYLDVLETESDKVYIIKLEKELYSKSTVLKSCYKFTDSAYIFIKSDKDNGTDLYKIYFKLKHNTEEQDIKEKFINELLDQELREIVLNETHKIRDTIVTRALLSGQSNDN